MYFILKKRWFHNFIKTKQLQFLNISVFSWIAIILFIKWVFSKSFSQEWWETHTKRPISWYINLNQSAPLVLRPWKTPCWRFDLYSHPTGRQAESQSHETLMREEGQTGWSRGRGGVLLPRWTFKAACLYGRAEQKRSRGSRACPRGDGQSAAAGITSQTRSRLRWKDALFLFLFFPRVFVDILGHKVRRHGMSWVVYSVESSGGIQGEFLHSNRRFITWAASLLDRLIIMFALSVRMTEETLKGVSEGYIM